MGKTPKKEHINWNEKKKRIVIDRTDEIDIDAEDTDEVERKLRKELSRIVQRVKGLKVRAEEVKETLDTISQAKANKTLK